MSYAHRCVVYRTQVKVLICQPIYEPTYELIYEPVRSPSGAHPQAYPRVWVWIHGSMNNYSPKGLEGIQDTTLPKIIVLLIYLLLCIHQLEVR
jgi:hypothetical protein